MTYIDSFDWSCYRGMTDIRFISGNDGALRSYGGTNLMVLLSTVVLLLRLFRLFMEYYSIWQIAHQLQSNPKSIHLHGMAEYTSEILSLYHVHFNQVLRAKRRVKPIPMPRIRMPLSLESQSLKMVLDEDDNLAVTFNFDCLKTTFISAHWGVPLKIVESVLISSPSSSNLKLPPNKECSNPIMKFIRKLLIPLHGPPGISLFDPSHNRNSQSKHCGDLSLLCNKQNYCSSEPICFNAGDKQPCTLSPSKKVVQLNGVDAPIWNALTLSQDDSENKCVPLVIVLYAPRTHESRIFSEGSIETHQGYAEVVLVRFKRSMNASLIGPLPTLLRVTAEVLKNVVFTSSGLEPQEPKDMFGMGDPRDIECLICIANKMDTVLLTCGHGSFCSGCLYGLRNEKCPVCRRNFSSSVKFPLKG